MYVRRIKSRKSICFQIGQKQCGKFKLIKHVGCASTHDEIEALRVKAKQDLQRMVLENQYALFPETQKPLRAKLLNWHIVGYHLVFGTVYDSIGFPNNMLRDLVVARIVYPKSKSATVRYLARYLGIVLDRDSVYRFLDTLDKDKLTQIAFEYVSRKNKGISLFFYDVTTLYFETDLEDDLRKKGFSKDHRIDTPQILVGLFVDHEGYPFDFDFFQGNTFEGHTFKPSIEKVKKKYCFTKLTIVADAGMLSEDNLSFLDSYHINYIVGARIKNLTSDITNKIINHDFTESIILEIKMKNQRLIVEYSEERAKKDGINREKIIEKLKKKLREGKSVIRKSKYLLLEDQGRIVGINEKKIEVDKKFDGLKGYVSNKDNGNSYKEIIDQYHNLWKIEKAFRMSKGDLKERPIFHQNIKRIESHLILCFVSLLVMKETERILKIKKYTVEKAIEILGKVGQGEIRIGNTKVDADTELDQEAQTIITLFEGH